MQVHYSFIVYGLRLSNHCLRFSCLLFTVELFISGLWIEADGLGVKGQGLRVRSWGLRVMIHGVAGGDGGLQKEDSWRG